MNYNYKIIHVNHADRMIFLSSNDFFDLEEPDAFIHLLKCITNDVGGKIENIGECQYLISGDELGLIYQWDGCFGISIAYPSNTTFSAVVEFLSRFIEQ